MHCRLHLMSLGSNDLLLLLLLLLLLHPSITYLIVL